MESNGLFKVLIFPPISPSLVPSLPNYLCSSITFPPCTIQQRHGNKDNPVLDSDKRSEKENFYFGLLSFPGIRSHDHLLAAINQCCMPSSVVPTAKLIRWGGWG